MRDTSSPNGSSSSLTITRSPQPASPADQTMTDSVTKSPSKKSDPEESILDTSSEKLQDTITSHESDVEPMDISNPSDCNSPQKYFCPICDISLTSQHEFTLHIRSHNNDNDIISDKGFVCKICSKILSSSSSLDRHVLVHSGERPFRCKICSVTFTTNGNMHRHMRTHAQKLGENYESDGSTDSNNSVTSSKSRKRRLEFNNNNDNKRKLDCYEEEDNYSNRRRSKSINNNNIDETNTQKYQCPVCDRKDFASLNVLENHLESSHPDFEIKCVSCNLNFKNHRALNLHRNMAHHTEQNLNSKNLRNSQTQLGFKDLTFVDFSSEKFPHIARYECEKNIHKPITGQKFICEKCQRAFPCSSALDMHQEECLKLKLQDNLIDLSRKNYTEEEMKRDDFFARLDLQNTSVTMEDESKVKVETKSATDSKDLADIQQILSMTSNGSLLQHLQAKPQISIDNIRNVEQQHEEESQDVFAAEFRKMKLRGEFPCRLCTAVFPNLRALKGHNRAHLTGSGNTGPYRCNMCPHSSVDKAALIRHMRTHNGDRPYECSLCNYAFTTKANCERHLRNRHSKVTREEVKKSIIYHPSEDPTNDEINKINNNKQSEELKEFKPILPKNINLPIMKPIISEPKIIIPKEEKPDFHFPRQLGFNYSPEISDNKIQVKNLENLQKSDYDTRSDEEESSNNLSSSFEDYQKTNADHPMDLSMDVLDLSKKKDTSKEEPHDFTKKTLESSIPSSSAAAAQLLLAQQLLKHPYMSHLTQFYQNPSIYPNLNLNLQPNLFPFLFPPPYLNSQQEIKERMLRLQLSGGSMITDQYPSVPLTPKSQISSFSSPEESKHSLHINTQLSAETSSKLQSPKPQQKPDMIHSPNSIKMVIKNGVLMPKQKQRRYRTERPFSCEHCSARFTLRSNMERHIKQQHPQFWSQRQRSGISGAGRKPTLQKSFFDLNVPNYDLQIPKNQNLVSQQIKYALLSKNIEGQNSSLPGKDDDEDALIIDEENEEKNNEYKSKSLQDQSKNNNEVGLLKLVKLEDLKNQETHENKLTKSLEEKMLELRQIREKELKNNNENEIKTSKNEETQDLVSVSRLLDNAVGAQLPFREYFRRDGDENEAEAASEDEEGLVASGSTSEGNGSGTDENKSENEAVLTNEPGKKKSAYSLAPNRVSCPYCHRKFPWTSSLRRHILTHTGQKPFKCSQCPLLFTTKSNCDRHLLRKHGNQTNTHAEPPVGNNQNYMMRNVPERPFKCSTCPSSTFSTLSNLKKHMSCKHTSSNQETIKSDEREYESFASSEDERNKITVSDQSSSDLPFKCHLCECSFAERQPALDHIKDSHVAEFELLIAKGALDVNNDEQMVNHEMDDDEQIRGKFPDYANRKVMCAFCMRRFWSAEDLRRHMRTHTGERPFSCDVCSRRFTLKHSMLRHRKKHNLEEGILISGDEEMKINNNNIVGKTSSGEDSGTEGNDLIGNLLGIRDKSIIDQVLVSSADDAAKLLGVNSKE